MFHPKGPTFRELARQALSSTTRGYDLLAPKFEYTPFRTPDALLTPLGPLLGEVDDAVDLCCGTGAAMWVLKPRCRRQVTGVDLSQGMLDEAARQLAEVPGEAEVRLVRADILDLPFEEAFDVATCFGAFGHLLEPDQDRFAASLHRALRPGGRFLFVTGEMPRVWDPSLWAARAFNLAMHVRNALFDPPFIMFYLTFPLPRAREVLERHGFSLDVRSGLFPRYPTAKLVIATKG